MAETHLIQSHDLFGPPERQDELLKCWHLNEGLFDHYTHPEGRLTFAQLFTLCKPGMVNVITNSDMYFDADTLRHFAAFPQDEKHCWALSRWDAKEDGSSALWDHRDSQDVYVVYGGPHIIDAHTALARADNAPDTLFEHPFTQGEAGCDNRLLHVLQEHGFVVTNPSRTVRTYHLHLSNYRSYVKVGQESGRGASKMVRIQPPWAFCAPTDL